VKLVMTLRTRNEADILDAQLSFHLNAGVDFVVAIDNGSDDGTTEILESYARDGYVSFTQDPNVYQEAAWVTQMARRAASEFGADWVVNSDADEFWWPRGGSFKEILAAVPKRYGSVRGMWRHFAPRPPGDDFFAERMTVRVCNPGAEDNTPYAPRYKTVHRADPDVEVLPGNHRALGRDLEPIRGWYPIDVLHFPIRSLRHFTEKYLRQWALLRTRFGERVNEAHEGGHLGELYETYVVDDLALAEGIADGTLAVDTRLRDALRSLRAKEALTFAGAAVDEGYLTEVALLEDGDPQAHAHRKVDDIEARLAAIESGSLTRIRKLVW
jgi:glycosyltransferase involved in cell wall biosynthesis